MEYLLCFGVVVGLPAWLIWRSIAAARVQRALIDRAWELENWEFFEDTHRVTINFRTMTALERYRSDWPGDATDTSYVVRREPSWEWQLTPEGHAVQLRTVRALVEKTIASAFYRDELAELESGQRRWKPVPPAWVPSIETAYQRYIRQG